VIAFVQGKISEIEPTHAVIDCGGIGYLVKISLNTYTRIQEEKGAVKLHTFLQVREDAQVLYGFAAKAERQLFEQLIGVSGVGGNTALVILSSLSPTDLIQAVRTEDVGTLKRVKGIGAKTAGRIVLELKDKLGADLGDGGSPAAAGGSGNVSERRAEALAALAQLGLNKQAITTQVDRILKEQGADLSVEEIVRIVLRNRG
jgi:Holliday junction DNA helicase RuvA